MLRSSCAIVLAAAAALAAAPSAAPAGPGQAAALRDVLPPEGLVAGSVAVVRDQADLDALYYLADESVLGLEGEAEAVFAAYEAWEAEALVLVAAYPAEPDAARVFARFGLDFFPGEFDPDASRHVARLETGDWAAAARAGRVLVVVLETPDRESCEALLGRLEERAAGFGR
ncbi:MAG: hypothetical protein KA243_09055 [Candidatus Aminicenantes bacterium]|nr:hypothetical protein [Candidatus Aminicenantes bacterium]